MSYAALMVSALVSVRVEEVARGSFTWELRDHRPPFPHVVRPAAPWVRFPRWDLAVSAALAALDGRRGRPALLA